MQSAPISRRVHLLDELRGFSILCMILYHGVYNVLLFLPVTFDFFFSPFMGFLQHFFAGGFILISGAACRFSRNNLKRGALCFLFGMAMTLITVLFVPKLPIYFGILHCLGACMIFFWLLRPLLDRVSPLILLAVFLFLFLVTYSIPQGMIGPPGLYQEPLPDFLFQAEWLFPIGIKTDSFFSADYFPLLPWLFLFLAGSCLGIPIREGRFPAFFYRLHSKFLSWAGRHTLWIYLLHQPVLFLLLWLIASLFPFGK